MSRDGQRPRPDFGGTRALPLGHLPPTTEPLDNFETELVEAHANAFESLGRPEPVRVYPAGVSIAEHHDRPALAGVVRELEAQPAIDRFLGSQHPRRTKRLRQAVGVLVRIIMERRGWKKTGRKGSLGVRANVTKGTKTPGACHNTAVLNEDSSQPGSTALRRTSTWGLSCEQGPFEYEE
jgi:hypothetical protein